MNNPFKDLLHPEKKVLFLAPNEKSFIFDKLLPGFIQFPLLECIFVPNLHVWSVPLVPRTNIDIS